MTSTTTPAVSIVMSAYNAADVLGPALDSLTAQDFEDVEFIICDDGSADDTASVITQKAKADPRIKPLLFRQNRGIVPTVTDGLAAARAPLIARADSDDLHMPDRLSRQVEFMAANPDIDLLGGFMQTFGDREMLFDYETDPDMVACCFLFRCAVAQPVAMIRRHVFDEWGLAYDPAHPFSQDWGLFSRIAARGRAANLDQVLAKYRFHDKKVGITNRPKQKAVANSIVRRIAGDIGVEASDVDIEVNFALDDADKGRRPYDADFPASAALNWLARLQQANRVSGYMPGEAFDALLGRMQAGAEAALAGGAS
ncbi:MAG: glycosyltransferase family 2 protein [Pseudomonadota bacterium]